MDFFSFFLSQFDPDISVFKPERWLKTDPATAAEVVYDSMAGPTLAFGAASGSFR